MRKSTWTAPLVALATLFGSVTAFAGVQLTGVTVNGDNEAKLQFTTTSAYKSEPSVSIRENVVEIIFPGLELSDKYVGKTELSHPHALIQTLSLTPSGSSAMKARLVVNGSPENLKSRVKGKSDSTGVTYQIAFPEGSPSAVSMLKEEQLPVMTEKKEVKEASALLTWKQIFVMFFVISLAGVCTFFFLRFLKSQGQIKGSRKYLIEQMAYCSTGAKTGVSLMRIGREFVLLGVTPSAVTFLSNLPKLQEEYAESSKFERGVFNEAVEREIERHKRPMVQS